MLLTSRLHMPVWPLLAAAALFGTFSGPQHLTQESHPETGRRYGSGGGGGCTETCVYGTSDGFCDDGGPGAEYSMCSLGTDCTDCGSRSSTHLPPPLAPPYSPPPGVSAAHALAFAATGILMLIFLVADHAKRVAEHAKGVADAMRVARIGMGEDVIVNGRRGKITSDDGTSNPYKVTFDEEVSGWLYPNQVTRAAAPAPTGRIMIGEYVMVNGRRGKITSDDGTSNPYKVTFDNGEVSGWLYPNQVTRAAAPTGRIAMGEYVMVNGRRGKITTDDGTSNPYKVTFDEEV
eukprot:jgi/Chrpa1/23781/Chrysochromulina_OHIO_Genome00025926-RA